MFYARRIGEQDGGRKSKQEATVLVQMRGNKSQNQVICDRVESRGWIQKLFFFFFLFSLVSKSLVCRCEEGKQGLPSDYSQVPRAWKLDRWCYSIAVGIGGRLSGTTQKTPSLVLYLKSSVSLRYLDLVIATDQPPRKDT